MGCGCNGCGCVAPTGAGQKKKGAVGAWIGVATAITASMVAIVVANGGSEPPAGDKPAAAPASAAAPGGAAKTPSSVYDFTMKRLDGTEESLGAYKGKVVLIVNTASGCGLTPQFEGLQKLYAEKKDAGLVVLGFPANDFKGQEPLGNSEIATFCTTKYSVTFPMFEKITVVGKDAHPLYKFLSSRPAPVGVEPTWNFTKFLVDRGGNVVARFDPRTKPDDAEMVKKIDELLAAKPAAPAGEGAKQGK